MDNTELLKILISRMTTLVTDIEEIKVTMAKQEENIRHHIKRTDLLEDYIARVKEDIEPLQRRKQMVDGALKVVGVVASVISFAAGIVKIYQFLN